MSDAPIHSLDGITLIVEWARAHRIVLSQRHQKLADKYKVDATGVVFDRYLKP